MALWCEAALLLAIAIRHEGKAIKEAQQEQSVTAPQASSAGDKVMATANLSIQTRERERRNQRRLDMKGLRQKPGTQPRQPDLTGEPWLKAFSLPIPAGGDIIDTMLGLVSLLPFLGKLTRREKRWRQ